METFHLMYHTAFYGKKSHVFFPKILHIYDVIIKTNKGKEKKFPTGLNFVSKHKISDLCKKITRLMSMQTTRKNILFSLSLLRVPAPKDNGHYFVANYTYEAYAKM